MCFEPAVFEFHTHSSNLIKKYKNNTVVILEKSIKKFVTIYNLLRR